MVRHQIVIATLVALTIGIFARAQERANWLSPQTMSTDSIAKNPDLDSILSPFGGSLRLLECIYHQASLQSVQPIAPKSKNWDWQIESRTLSSKDVGKGIELTLTVKRTGPSIQSAGLALMLPFTQWAETHYVMAPASVYNGNRNRIVTRPYAQGLDRSDLYRKDLPQTTVDLPRLSPCGEKTSRFEIRTCNTTTPALCFWDRNIQQGFIILAEQGITHNGQVIDHGLIIEENADRSQAALVISFPGVRDKKPEFIGFSASPDRGITWNPGDAYTIRLHLYRFPTRHIPEFLDRFMTVRKSLTGTNTPRNLYPKSEVLKLMVKNIDRRFCVNGNNKFYCPENAEWISYGWVGGLMNTFPILALGDQEHRNQVRTTFDFGLSLGQGKSGYFFGALDKTGQPFGREGYPENAHIVLTRKNADVLYWMLKQMMLMKQQGHAIKHEWEQSVRRLADAFVRTWKQEGQWGNFVDNQSGRIVVYNTSGGVMAIAGLALASQYFQYPEYLTIALQAGEYYYRQFRETGMTTGGCADILQNADSETAIAQTTAFMTLYEITNNPQWLNYCQESAALVSTWVVSYDYVLPPQTPLAKHGAQLSGSVWASTQNKHGAPGFCTQSGDVLFRLYRKTGDRRYADLLRDVIHAHAEGIQPNGLISERLTYCDADSRGAWEGRTGWTETNGAMMAIEIPSIYICLDRQELYCFDSVKATLVKQTEHSTILEMTNPTSYAAEVSVMAETSAEAQRMLPVIAFPQWKRIRVPAGQTIRISLP